MPGFFMRRTSLQGGGAFKDPPAGACFTWFAGPDLLESENVFFKKMKLAGFNRMIYSADDPGY
jgi:hypothetical protein